MESDTRKLPEGVVAIVPMRNVVLFPGVLLPISVGRAKSVAAVQYALQNKAPLGIVMQRDARVDDPGRDDLHPVGTLANVVHHVVAGDGLHHAVCQGVARFRIEELVEGYPFVAARIQRIEDGWGQVSFDRYPVLVTRLPTRIAGVTSAETLLEHIRLNLNSVVDTNLAEFEPYDRAIDGPRWASSNAVGAVLHIDMGGPDNGSVMCVEHSERHWRVATIHTPRDGWHPLSGHREWGISRVDGGFEVYTRAADRTCCVEGAATHLLAYTIANNLWTTFQEKVAQLVNSNGGAATVRPPMTDWRLWWNVRGMHRPTVPWV